MKKFLLLVFALTCIGCSGGLTKEGVTFKDYLRQPRLLIKDPHFAEYKEERDKIEALYLNKTIDYVEYTRRMDELDEDYTKEVQARDEKIHE